MTNPTQASAEQLAKPELSPLELFDELQGRIEHILDKRSLTAESVSVALLDDLGRPSWVRLSLYVEQLRGQKKSVADVALGACWGQTEGGADQPESCISRSRLENEADQARNLGRLAVLDIYVSAVEATI